MDDTLKYILFPLEVGNPVAAAERLASHISKSNNIRGSGKIKLVKSIIKEIITERLSKREQNEIINILSQLLNNNSKILQELNDMPLNKISTSGEVGKANCLFIVDSSQDIFGCIHSITATTTKDGKGEIKYVNSNNVISGAIQVVIEAIKNSLNKYGLNIRGFNNFYNYSFSVQIGTINNSYDGASLCLPAAVAIMSSLINKPVEQSLAFTGEVNNIGEIKKIRDVNKKIDAAILKEVKKVYVPEENINEVNDVKDIEIISKSHIDKVMEDVFDIEEIHKLIKSLNGGTIEMKHDIPFDNKGSRIMISMVGNRDPYGASFNKPEEFSEGSILTAFRKIMPDTVCMIATPSTENNARQTGDILKKICNNCNVKYEVIKFNDPTDYDGIYVGILYMLQSIKELMRDKNVFLSISSGTPQMQTVLINLLQSKKLKAHLIQVREPKFTSSWEDRVRLVKSEYLGIGI